MMSGQTREVPAAKASENAVKSYDDVKKELLHAINAYQNNYIFFTNEHDAAASTIKGAIATVDKHNCLDIIKLNALACFVAALNNFLANDKDGDFAKSLAKFKLNNAKDFSDDSLKTVSIMHRGLVGCLETHLSYKTDFISDHWTTHDPIGDFVRNFGALTSVPVPQGPQA